MNNLITDNDNIVIEKRFIKYGLSGTDLLTFAIIYQECKSSTHHVCNKPNSYFAKILCCSIPYINTVLKRLVSKHIIIKNVQPGDNGTYNYFLPENIDTILNGELPNVNKEEIQRTPEAITHNNVELQKWFNFLDSIINKYDHLDAEKNKNYRLLVSIYITRILDSEEVVHHIDLNHNNNYIYNLLVFDSKKSHSQYHNCADAIISYNEDKHNFTCSRLS